MRSLPEVVQLELQLALQCPPGSQGAAAAALTFGQVVRWLADEQASSVLEHGRRGG
jgi:hypothetical protein